MTAFFDYFLAAIWTTIHLVTPAQYTRQMKRMSADGQYIRLNTKTNAALLKLKLTEVFTDPAFSLISLVEYIESVF